jgi:hypothetical protein
MSFGGCGKKMQSSQLDEAIFQVDSEFLFRDIIIKN